MPGPELEGVVVILEDDRGRIALQLRDAGAGVSYPDHWGLFGGQIEAGETAEQAAIREVQEELGRTLGDARLARLGTQIIAWPSGPLLLPCRVHVLGYPVAGDLDGAAVREGRSLAFLSPRQIRAARVVPPHLGILEWYWGSKEAGPRPSGQRSERKE